MNEVGQIDHLLKENSDLRMERRKLKRKYERLKDALEEMLTDLEWNEDGVLRMSAIAKSALAADKLDTI